MLKEFFYLNRSDRRAIIFLLCIGVIAIVIFKIIPNTKTNTSSEYSRNTIHHTGKYDRGKILVSDNQMDEPELEDKREIQPFTFDPNTAKAEDFIKLGLAPWQARSIIKYRNKGGIFRRKEDFARVYGLTQGQYLKLLPYIIIGKDYQPAIELISSKNNSNKEKELYIVPHQEKVKAMASISLNLSDTLTLKKVPGIGSYFARKIVYYREKLGGFYSIEQLREIDNFPQESLPYFILSDLEIQNIKKLNINSLTLSQLKTHPYISYFQAKAIIDFRRLKGKIDNIEVLSTLKVFSPQDIDRLRHYVILQ